MIAGAEGRTKTKCTKKKRELLDHTKSKQLLMGIYAALISIAGSCATAEPGGAAAIGCIAVLLNTLVDNFLTHIGMAHRASAYKRAHDGRNMGSHRPWFLHFTKELRRADGLSLQCSRFRWYSKQRSVFH